MPLVAVAGLHIAGEVMSKDMLNFIWGADGQVYG